MENININANDKGNANFLQIIAKKCTLVFIEIIGFLILVSISYHIVINPIFFFRTNASASASVNDKLDSIMITFLLRDMHFVIAHFQWISKVLVELNQDNRHAINPILSLMASNHDICVDVYVTVKIILALQLKVLFIFKKFFIDIFQRTVFKPFLKYLNGIYIKLYKEILTQLLAANEGEKNEKEEKGEHKKDNNYHCNIYIYMHTMI
ncbi:hypothetical protein RFI_12700 [Reticulomyxa filosa]|uniref:Uncharacterized protein n=1 Tax=Reticulomyxa filosa TaxID=46433 RepID=X6NGI4_RETFI|nr:hypothetical protein RFI_12700 [Reticulomyxa filosa]|eukprot:ETO24457.1 hypothetical protein RFI_12700 [Reticulomyxa filosa]